MALTKDSAIAAVPIQPADFPGRRFQPSEMTMQPSSGKPRTRKPYLSGDAGGS